MAKTLISNQAEREEEDFLGDTTCSTTAHRVQRSLALSTPSLKSGKGALSLDSYMTSASSLEDGVIYEVKFGQPGFSQHEFVVRQRGNSCMLIQAWLGKIKLGDWLKEHLSTVSTKVFIARLQDVERSLQQGDERQFRAALESTFSVTATDKEWNREWGMNWVRGTLGMDFEWTAYEAKTA